MENKIRLKFNEVDFSTFCTVEDVRTSFLSVTNEVSKIPGKKGMVFRKMQTNSKIIEVDIRIIKDKKEEVILKADEIKKYLITKNPKKLYTRDNKNMYYLAVIDGEMNFEKLLNTGFITLRFLSLSGLKYSDDITNSSTNNGNVENTWTLEGTVTSETIKVIKKSTLEKIQVDTSNYLNQNIKIKSEEETVSINNNLIMDKLHFDSDFFMLDLGENEIQVIGISNHTIKNRARWI